VELGLREAFHRMKQKTISDDIFGSFILLEPAEVIRVDAIIASTEPPRSISPGTWIQDMKQDRA
jgi:hypothetical protein